VGGRWDELGALQFDFLRARGLEPHHRLLDVGCGSLRGGVHAIAYLEPGHYVGIEKERALLDAGRNVELPRAGLVQARPLLHVTGDFDLTWLEPAVRFDFALAQSVFTHLRPGLIDRCVRSVLPRLAPGGAFYATFFESTDGEDWLGPSHGWREDELQHPRYTVDTLTRLAIGAGGALEYIGAWGHPRDQRMVVIRAAGEGRAESA
jgi:SAM-dependent methyltransferase